MAALTLAPHALSTAALTAGRALSASLATSDAAPVVGRAPFGPPAASGAALAAGRAPSSPPAMFLTATAAVAVVGMRQAPLSRASWAMEMQPYLCPSLHPPPFSSSAPPP